MVFGHKGAGERRQKNLGWLTFTILLLTDLMFWYLDIGNFN